MANVTKQSVFTLFLLSTAVFSFAQTAPLSIETCQELARANYPLIKKRDLITQSRDYSVANASKGYFPQFSVNGQATYQSAVTRLPIEAPGIEVPQLKKDQYKIYAEVNQRLFDGGEIKHQKEASEVEAAIAGQNLEVALYQLKSQVNQLFFGILTIDEQFRQNELLLSDIELGLTKTQAAVANGAALKSDADVLRAELLKARQRDTELKATRKAYTDMLSLFTNRPLDERIKLDKPAPLTLSAAVNRPELGLYHAQLDKLDIQEKDIRTRNLPKFNLFFQGGYGRPALNILEPAFDTYYIGGIRLSWNFAGLYTYKNEKALIDINRRQIDLDKEVFLFNTDLTIRQQQAEINRYQELLADDDEIINLRVNIKNKAMAKLENGVINSSDYLREVNAEDQARLSKIVHEIQLLSALYSYQTTTGN